MLYFSLFTKLTKPNKPFLRKLHQIATGTIRLYRSAAKEALRRLLLGPQNCCVEVVIYITFDVVYLYRSIGRDSVATTF